MVGPGIELILGARNDDHFGTVIAVGLGGTLVEVMRRASVCLGPVDLTTARTMLTETPAARILTGTRGAGPFDIDDAARAVSAFSTFASTTNGVLAALEINPLIVLEAGHGAVGVDAIFEASETHQPDEKDGPSRAEGAT